MIENIPAELRAIPQWVVAGPNKVPINPRTGKLADPADPLTGGTFAEAVQCGMQHVGFILADSDPFTIIDLDDPYLDKQKAPIVAGHPEFTEALSRAARHTKIFEAFETYAEVSQSGRGLHLVMKGKIPCGVRRDKVEIYSKERYMIFTGQVLRNAPVADCQAGLDSLFSEMGKLVSKEGALIEEEPICEDSKIWAMATSADNAEKFTQLCAGDWQQLKIYPSQSEADYALLSMLAFYTRSNEQIRRMFRQTKLGQRKKSVKNDVYIDRSLRRIRAKEAPLVDVSKLTPIGEPLRLQGQLPLEGVPVIGDEAPGWRYTFPPGLVGDVARYILSSSIRPVPEIALAAALALCAGICGRSYNISGTGLNQYIILIAKTGRGKEGAATGIDNLIAAVRQIIPMADQFIGPGAFASGQALIKTVDKQPCFVSILGEFGLTLQEICDPRATGPNLMFRKVLLDIYGKSGHSKLLHPSAYSDSEKTTKLIQAPNVTLLGESTPDNFFNGLDSSHIGEGLIPRFLVIEYKGNRPPPNPKAFHPPDQKLVSDFGQFVTVAVNTAQNHTCCPVSISEDALRVFDILNLEADNFINETEADIDVELWNRAHLKAIKIAGLIAAGVNPHSPVVTLDIAKWADELIRLEIGGMQRHFSSGDVGSGEAKQEAEIRRLFKHFQTLTEKQRANHRCPVALMGVEVVPLQFLTVYSRRLACFKNDRRGAGRALSETLQDMVKREVFEMVGLMQLQTEYNMKSPIYYPGPGWDC